MGHQTSGFQAHSATHDPLFSTTGPLEHYRIPKHKDPGTLGSLTPTVSAMPRAGIAGLPLRLWSALSHASCPLKHSNDRAGTHALAFFRKQQPGRAEPRERCCKDFREPMRGQEVGRQEDKLSRSHWHSGTITASHPAESSTLPCVWVCTELGRPADGSAHEHVVGNS